MPGENFGMAFLNPLGEIQRQEIEAQKAPAELAHLQALTKVNEANANAMQMSQELQAAGMTAMRGFEFDPKNPTKSLLEMAGRMAPTQPLLTEKIVQAASTSLQREAQAAAQQALAEERLLKAAKGQIEALVHAYADLPSTAPEMLGLARSMARRELEAAGAAPEEIDSAINSIEGAIKTHGPRATQYLRDYGLTQYQKLEAKFKAAAEARQERALRERERHDLAMEEVATTRAEATAARAAASTKVGGKAEPRPRLSIEGAVKSAAAEVNVDPILSTGEAADKLNWSRQIGQAAIEKIDASYAERMRNPNIPLKDMKTAIREAKAEVLSRVKQDPTVMGRLMQRLGMQAGGGVAREKPEQELPADLSNFKPEENVIYTRGGKRYKYDAARNGLVKVE